MPETLGVAVGVCEGVLVGEALSRGDLLGVMEGVAPKESVAVGVAVTVELELRVLVGVGEGVSLPVFEEVGLGVGEGVEEGVGLLERELLGVLEGEAPTVRDAVRVTDSVLLPVSVVEGVEVGV